MKRFQCKRSDVILAFIFLLGLSSLYFFSPPKYFFSYFIYIEKFTQLHPHSSIIIFCLIHILAACFAIPGACTILNLSAGAIWGWPKAILMLYPITLISAALVYFVGRNFSQRKPAFLAPYIEKIIVFQQQGKVRTWIWLLGLRISPLLPYNIVNFSCGYLQIPFSKFLISTMIGISLDIVILTEIGRAIRIAL